LLGKYRKVGSASRRNARIDDTPLPQHQRITKHWSRMLNHHTHLTDPIRDKKTHAFDTSMASPSRQHNFAVRVSHRYIVAVAEFERSRRVWALPPSLGALAEFGRSRQRRPWTSGNYAGIYMSFKNVFICHNDLKRHINVEIFSSN